MTDHKMMVRRGRYIQDLLHSGQGELARSIGLRIVLEAALLQKTAVYGKLAAFGVYMRERWRKRIFARNEMSRYSMLCSGLYVKCYRLATGQGLLSTAEERSEFSVTPALLANSAALETVNVGWAGISYP